MGMDKQIVEIRTLKPGRYILIDNVPCRITAITHSKPGKHGGAKAKIDAIGIFDNQKRSVIKPAGQKVEVPIIHKRTAQVLTTIGDRVQLMDMETYETFELPLEEEIKDKISEGMEVIYMESMGQRMILQVKGE